MFFPLLLLAFGAIFGGFVFRDVIIGLGTPALGNSVFTNWLNYNIIDAEFLHTILKNIPLVFTLLGISLSFLLIGTPFLSNFFVLKKSRVGFYTYTFLTQKWHYDQFFNEFLFVRVMNFGYNSSFKLVDKGLIEVFGVTGASYNIKKDSQIFANMQSGLIYHYSFVIFVSLMLSLYAIIFYSVSSFLVISSMFICFVFSYFFYSLSV